MATMKLIPFKVESLENHFDSIPYGVKQCEADQMWDEEKGDCVVAVIDSGFEEKHPFLKDSIIGTKNFTNEIPTDINGHGTHVAGIVKSVAPSVKLLGIKVLDRYGGGSYDTIIKGINYAVHWRGPNKERVRVINMSLGGPADVKELNTAILNAVDAGILVVVAAGNEGDNREDTYEYGYPALYNECVTVAACNEDQKLAGFSNNSLQVDIIAAGVNVLSSYLHGTYAKLSGTSMASPHVAGIAALLIPYFERKFKRTLTESEIYSQIVKCCCTLGYEKSSEGNGLPKLTAAFKECEE
jgi:major intracellular serine protease